MEIDYLANLGMTVKCLTRWKLPIELIIYIIHNFICKVKPYNNIGTDISFFIETRNYYYTKFTPLLFYITQQYKKINIHTGITHFLIMRCSNSPNIEKINYYNVASIYDFHKTYSCLGKCFSNYFDANCFKIVQSYKQNTDSNNIKIYNEIIEQLHIHNVRIDNIHELILYSQSKFYSTKPMIYVFALKNKSPNDLPKEYIRTII